MREPLTLEVPEDHLVMIDLLDVLRQQRHLAPAARRVDHELRNRQTARPPAQRLDDLQPLLHGGPEVLAAGDLVSLIYVSTVHFDGNQLTVF